MNVTEKNWQPESGNTAYRSVKFQDEAGKNASVPKETAAKASDKISDRSDFKMQSSAPKDSVGQLASELARSETRLDVLQVLSKATRALASLKMSAYSCEGDDAKKVAQMIKRMEKLIKRIQKKVKQLGTEEQGRLEIKTVFPLSRSGKSCAPNETNDAGKSGTMPRRNWQKTERNP